MYAQATNIAIWKTSIWDFFSNHKNIWIYAGCEGFIVQQSKLLAELHLVHPPNLNKD